jgi:hypothetical protein
MDNNIKILTVATHKKGMYNDLVNNNNVITLGMGMKWTGFNMKYELVYDYIKDLDNDIIIVYVDGYDSLINNDPQIAINKFKQNNYKLLFSQEVKNKSLLSMLNRRVFTGGYFNDLHIINSGLYMGYVKYLKELLPQLIKCNCNDDQVNINKLYNTNKYFNNIISIDFNKEIFHNLKLESKLPSSPFISFPSTAPGRKSRAIYEYTQFYIDICIFLFFTINMSIFLYDKPKLILLNLIFIILLFVDKSCIL